MSIKLLINLCLVFFSLLATQCLADVKQHFSVYLKRYLNDYSGYDEAGLEGFELSQYLSQYYLSFLHDLNQNVPLDKSLLITEQSAVSFPNLVQLTWPRRYYSYTPNASSTVVLGAPSQEQVIEAEKHYLVLRDTGSGFEKISSSSPSIQTLTRNVEPGLLSAETFSFYDYLSDRELSQFIRYAIVPVSPATDVEITCEDTELVAVESYSISISGIVSMQAIQGNMEICLSPAYVDLEQEAINNAEVIFEGDLVTKRFSAVIAAASYVLQ